MNQEYEFNIENEKSKKQNHKMTIFACILSVVSIGLLALGFIMVSSDKVIMLQSISNLTNKIEKYMDENTDIYDKISSSNNIGVRSKLNLEIPSLNITGNLSVDYLENKLDKKSLMSLILSLYETELFGTKIALNEGKIYAKINDITPNYYYTSLDYYTLFSNLNSEDYNKFISLLVDSFNSNVDSKNIIKNKETILYNGKNKKVNKLSYEITEKEMNKIIKKYLELIKKDKSLVSHISETVKMSSEDVTAYLDQIINSIENGSNKKVLSYNVYYYGFNKIVSYELELDEIILNYTIGKNETFKIIVGNETVCNIEITKDKKQKNIAGFINTEMTNNIDIVGYQNDNKIELTFTINDQVLTIESTYSKKDYELKNNYVFAFYNKNNKEDKIEIKLDVDTKYYFNEKVDVDLSNSTNIEKITEEDQNTIYNNLLNHPLYSLFQQVSNTLESFNISL